MRSDIRWSFVPGIHLLHPARRLFPATLLVLLAAASGGIASTVTFEAPFTSYQTLGFKAGVAAGDIDSDGHVDLVVANEAGATAGVLHGNGDGTFSNGVPITVGTFQTFLVLVDLNGDGKLDVVVARTATVSVALGNGDGTFGPPADYATATSLSSPILRVVRLVDLTSDGRLDIVVNENSQPLSLFAGNGDGTFGPRTTLAVEARFFVLADVNGDGRPDLLTTTENALTVQLGTGPGTFGAPAHYTAPGGRFIRLVTGDWNNDGQVDVAASASNGLNDVLGDVAVFPGTGSGSFGSAVRYAVQANPSQILAADLDADGDLDLVTGNLPQTYGGTLSVLRGRGDGTFNSTRDHPMCNMVRGLTAADFDEDGLPDVAVACRPGSSVEIFRSNGDATFGAIRSTRVGERPFVVEIGDIDADGRLDALTVAVYGESIAVALGDGNGNLGVPIATSALIPGGVAYFKLGDLNGDAKLDLVTTPTDFAPDSNVSTWLGNGDGTFQDPSTWLTGPSPVRVELEDFNGDGRLDIMAANFGAADTGRTVSLLLGNGDGTFDPPTQIETGLRPQSVHVADLDGNGTEDVIVGHRLSKWISVLLGNGDGTFDPPVNYALDDYTRLITTGDVDEDGALDIVVDVGNMSLLGGNSSLLEGAGDGTFGSPTPIPVSGVAFLEGLEDMDLDGHLDVLMAVGYNSAFRVMRGDGAGSFDEPPFDYGTGAAPGYPAFGDFNGDGLLDVVTANHWLDDLAIVLNSTPLPPVSIPGERATVTPGLRVFPHPAHGDLLVEYTVPGRGPARIELFDLSGRRIVGRDVAMEAGVRRLRISEGRLEAGLYFVKVSQAGKSRTARAVVLD